MTKQQWIANLVDLAGAHTDIDEADLEREANILFDDEIEYMVEMKPPAYYLSGFLAQCKWSS
jgi:hypothetical protein